MIGQTVSHYNIIEKLGQGGMGVVYKAEDTTLDRLVALKFLPPHLNASAEDKLRFIQEAKAAAALNHPNICTVYGIEEHDGQMFIAMELVEGQTLRERRGTITFKQAIDIGIQIADGLAAAHDKGVVHRDIKPENIMVRKDGIAQIMDFGLAKLRNASSQINRLTKQGSTVGTAGYMSPEQVQGQDADHRSDIFSFGVLLFELITGQLPFKGIHETALAYEIVNVDAPPMSSIKPEVDPSLDAVVLECLEKDPNERTQSIKQVSIDLKRYRRESSRQRVSRITASRPAYSSTIQPPEPPEPAERQSGIAAPAPSAPAGSSKLPWIVAAIAIIAAAALGYLYMSGSKPQLKTVRSTLLPPESYAYASASGSAGEGHLALSPDGNTLAFVAIDSSGRTHLMVKAMSSYVSKELPSTEGAYYPFWSPDNRFIAFFQTGKLKKIEASGGPSITLCDASDARGGSWGRDGVIIFTPSAVDPILQVPASGGTPQQVTKLDSSLHQRTHRWPSFLPDGKHFLYFGRSSFGGVEREEDGIYVGSLDGKETKRLGIGKSNVVFASGFLLFLRENSLMAQRFDPDKLELSGEAMPIAEPVEYDLGYNRAVFSASENGLVVFQQSTSHSGFLLEWYDPKGRSLGTIGELGQYSDAILSPDGKSIAFDLYDAQTKNRDIWLYDIARKLRTRFTFDSNVDQVPVWSPDGSQINFQSDRKGHYDLYKKMTSGSGIEEVLVESETQKFPSSWSHDGKFIGFTAIEQKTSGDLWIVPLDGTATDRKPLLFLQTNFNEQNPVFSPDVKWIAYDSDESGSFEVYVRPFGYSNGTFTVSAGGKWQVSTSGINPNSFKRWSKDGKKIYFQSNDNKMMAAEIFAQGSNFSVGKVEPLFEIKNKGLSLFQDVTPDAQKFLFANAVGGESKAPVSLITNWDAELVKK